MNALLWVLVVGGLLNTIAIVLVGFQPASPTTRRVDALYTIVLMVWAVVLLANKAGG